MSTQEQRNLPKDNDIDLRSLFSIMARGFRNTGRAIRAATNAVAKGLLNILIFIKHRLIWFLLAAVVGYGWIYLFDKPAEAGYSSEMTARFNFGGTFALYNTVAYCNALISQGRYDELAKLLSVSPEEAGHLMHFQAEPVQNEILVSDLYRRNFLMRSRSIIRADTFWTRSVPFDEFKRLLTKFDIPVQRIRVTSSKPDIFSRIQKGFLQYITAGEDLRSSYAKKTKLLDEEEKLILSSLASLDTLQSVYEERLLRSATGTPLPSATINLMERSYTVPVPELQVHDKVLALLDELRELRTYSADNSEPVQVYASFSPVGQKNESLWASDINRILVALLIAAVILTGIKGYKALGVYERRMRSRNVN